MRTALSFGVALLLALSISMARDDLLARLIFQPTPGVDFTPQALGIEASEVWIETEDAVRIHGFFLPARASAGRDPERAILFLHGNAGNASHRLANAAELARLGSDVLLLDYRGYGRSQGTPSERGVYADARAGLDYLVRQRDLPGSRVVLFGRSLGGAVSVELARGRELAGVILESTFTSLADMGARLLGPPGRWLAGGGFDSLSRIGELKAPLLFFHGDHDTIVPFALGRALFEAAPQPRAFETLAGAGHNDTVIVGGRAYFERIGRFLDEVAPLRTGNENARADPARDRRTVMTGTRFRLISDAFDEGGSIPREYSCEGEDLSPPLRWSHAPAGTRSFALRVVDPDAPAREFTHWLLFDLPADSHQLAKGESGGGVEGRNDFQRVGWGGPCPPPKHGDHRYFFTLWALDCESLGLAEGVTRAEVERAIEGHVLGEATYRGRYRRD